MDMTALMLSFLFGTIGFGYIIYARRSERLIPMVSGVLLIICPYFISGNLLMTVLCVTLMAAPFFIGRD